MQELTKKQAFWKEHIDALTAFDGRAAEYARQHDLDVKRLYFFKAQLRRRAGSAVSTARFVPVTGLAMNGHHGVVVALPNGVRLALANLDAPGLLERLARL